MLKNPFAPRLLKKVQMQGGARCVVRGVLRLYGTTGLTYRIIAWVVPRTDQNHMRKEADHEKGYHTRGPR